MSNSTIVASSPLNSGSHSHMSSNSSSVIHSNAVGNSVLSSSSSPMLTASGTSDAISQCHNILNMLRSQPNAAKTEANTSSAYMAGICSVPRKSAHVTGQWIVDFEACGHICFIKELFDSLIPITTSIVLPNNTRLVVNFVGTIQLCDLLFFGRFCMFLSFGIICSLSVH